MAKRFNPAPGWPEPPPGWTPPSGWRPDPSWPPAPPGWEVMIDDEPVDPGPTVRERIRARAQAAGEQFADLGAADPETLWQGQSNTLGSAATGGKMTKGRYRLTQDMLYFESGVLSTNAQQIPVAQIVDVDVRQSLTQKARGVGDVVVHVERPSNPTGREVVLLESIADPRAAQTILNQVSKAARLVVQQRQNTVRYEGVVVPPMPPMPMAAPPVAPAAPVANAVDPMDQIRKLGELRDAGLLTDEEFSAKKAQILDRM